MPRSIDELNITNFVDTGLTTPLARYTFNLEIKWTNDNGTTGEHSATYTFPNDLSLMPLNVRRAFAIKMIDAAVRVQLDLNTWDEILGRI